MDCTKPHVSPGITTNNSLNVTVDWAFPNAVQKPTPTRTPTAAVMTTTTMTMIVLIHHSKATIATITNRRTMVRILGIIIVLWTKIMIFRPLVPSCFQQQSPRNQNHRVKWHDSWRPRRRHHDAKKDANTVPSNWEASERFVHSIEHWNYSSKFMHTLKKRSHWMPQRIMIIIIIIIIGRKRMICCWETGIIGPCVHTKLPNLFRRNCWNLLTFATSCWGFAPTRIRISIRIRTRI
mmetsp:Transcript_26150/g.47464  ORF Transcript_26150/g.47464 Transcript_26150/m.47464 type:complete len:236 (-) Transcript_26150:474-1181(-)